MLEILARLKTIVAERAAWADQVAQIKCLHGWLLEVEHILDGSRTSAGEAVSNATVGSRLDSWREQMAKHLSDGSLSELERECLTAFLQVLSNEARRTWCSVTIGRISRAPIMRWNAASVDGSTRYRRISGRKNWNAYLLRYGRSVAYYEWWEQDAARHQQLIERASKLDRAGFRALRHETTLVQHEQLTRFRFRNIRQALLASLEARWAAAAPTPLLP